MMATRRMIFGLVIVGFGVILLLQNLNLITMSFGEIIGKFWPLLLMGWGFSVILERGSGGKVVGSFIFLLGLIFLSRNLGWFQFDFHLFWRLFWPAILILLGIRFLLGSGGRTGFAFMGEIDRTQGPWELKSHSYWAVMGGIKMDVRNAVY